MEGEVTSEGEFKSEGEFMSKGELMSEEEFMHIRLNLVAGRSYTMSEGSKEKVATDINENKDIHVHTTRERCFCKTSFQVRMDQKKVQKQGGDERTQEDYPTSAV